MKFRQSLALALVVTAIVLTWNAYESPNLFKIGNESKSFNEKSTTIDGREYGVTSLDNFSQSFVSAVSNKRLSSILQASVPKDYCFQAFSKNSDAFGLDPIIGLNSNNALIPASANKLITAAVVLSTFEKSKTLDTELLAESKGPSLKKAYLKTSGDPSFVSVTTLSPRRPSYLSPKNTRTFAEFAKSIADSGVKNIDELIIENSWFGLPQVERGWEKDKLQVGQISALNIDEGFDGVTLSPDPDIFAASILSRELEAQGVSVGKITSGQLPEENFSSENSIAKTSSPTIETLVADMLKTSDNVYAEQLLAAAAKTEYDIVDLKTRSTFVKDSLEELGAKLDNFVFENGSGYSRDSRLSCALTNQIIQIMNEKGIDLTSLSSIAGVDGTLETRFAEYKSTLKAKTGTLDNVTALSGSLEDRFIFTFFANSAFDLETGFRLQETVVTNLDSYPFVKRPQL